MAKYDYYTHNITKTKKRYLQKESKKPTLYIVIFLLCIIVIIVTLERLNVLTIPFLKRWLDAFVSFVHDLFSPAVQ